MNKLIMTYVRFLKKREQLISEINEITTKIDSNKMYKEISDRLEKFKIIKNQASLITENPKMELRQVILEVIKNASEIEIDFIDNLIEHYTLNTYLDYTNKEIEKVEKYIKRDCDCSFPIPLKYKKTVDETYIEDKIDIYEHSICPLCGKEKTRRYYDSSKHLLFMDNIDLIEDIEVSYDSATEIKLYTREKAIELVSSETNLDKEIIEIMFEMHVPFFKHTELIKNKKK